MNGTVVAEKGISPNIIGAILAPKTVVANRYRDLTDRGH